MKPIRKNFGSDNVGPISPAILDTLDDLAAGPLFQIKLQEVRIDDIHIGRFG